MAEIPHDLQALLARGRDPERFAEEILGVRLNPAQRRWIRLHAPTPEGGWPYHKTAHVSGNQVGKSVGVAILIAWATTYKIGIDYSDSKLWLDTPYYWFHVAPRQAQAYIPLGDIEQLVKGSHPAQYDKQTKKYRKCLLPQGLFSFGEIETGYRGFSTLTGAVAQFRTTDEKAKALQGRRAHGISFDEAAFENHLIEVIDTALSMRLISTGGPMVLVSTPDGMNDWYEVIEKIRLQSEPHPTEPRVWTGDDVALVVSHISDNVGYGIDPDEAARKERELPEETKEQQLRGAFLEPMEAFFVPGKSIEETAFVPGMPEYVEPLPGHRYVIFWDPSISSDPCAAYVLDTTTKPWKVVQEIYEAKPKGFVWLLSRMREVHADRNLPARAEMGEQQSPSRAVTGYDASSMGGAIFRESLKGLRPQKPIEFGGASGFKLDVLGDLRAALLSGQLLIPDSMVGLKREVLNYRLDDAKIKQDRVMALSGAVHVASKFSGVHTAKFSPHGRATVPQYRVAR